VVYRRIESRERVVNRYCFALLFFLVTGCDQGVKVTEPPVVLVASEDERLVEFIQEKLELAQQNPKSDLHRGRLAMAYDANGFREEAVTTYSQAQQLSPNSFRWPYLKAHLLAAMGDIENAVLNIDQAISINPDYAPAYIQKGVWQLDQGFSEQARESFGLLDRFELDRTQLQAVSTYKAVALLRLEEPDLARQLLEPIADDSAHPFITRQLAQTYRMLGLSDQASNRNPSSSESSELKWADPEAASKLNFVRTFSGMLFMAEELIESSRADAAIEILENLQRTHPDEVSVINNLGIAYKLQGESQRALDLFLNSIRTRPDSHLLHFNVGTVYEEIGEVSKAIEHFQEAIKVKPNLLPAYDRLIQLLVRSSRNDEAYVLILRALRETEGNAEIFRLAGMLAGLQDDWVQSTEFFRKVIELEPRNIKAHTFLIRSLLSQGREREVQEALDFTRKIRLPQAAFDEFQNSGETSMHATQSN